MSSLTSELMPAPADLLPGPPRQDGRPSLAQCLTLAVLIHVLVVLVFGSAPGGSARPGEGVWGTLNIRLTGSDATGRNEATVAAEAHSGPAGTATRQRWGGAVRSPDLAEPPLSTPGAAREGIWQPQPAQTSQRAAETEAPSPTTVPALAAPAKVDTAPIPSTSPEAAPAARGPMPAPAAAATLPTPAPANPLPLAPTPPADVAPGTPAQRAAPGANLPMPALDTPAAAPAAVDAPAPTPGPPTPGRVAPQRINPVAIPLPSAPPLPAAPLEQLPLPTLPPTAAAPAPAAPLAAVPPVPATPTPPPESTSPAPPAAAPPPRAPRPAVPIAPAEPAAAAAVTAPTEATAADTAAAAPEAPVPATALPAAAPAAVAPAAAGSRSVPGAPDAGSRVGHDVATAPSQPPSAPRLNLDLVRPRGGPISAQGSRGLLPMMPVPPDTRSKLADDLKNAAKPDCRTAYAGMGVLAAVPLAADALRDKGCRW